MRNRCVILCSGPSIRTTWPDSAKLPPGGLTILAINEAGRWYAHDWFVAWDTLDALDQFRPNPRLGVAGRPSMLADVGAVQAGLEFFPLPNQPKTLRNYTLPRAAALVAHLGFVDAWVYGCDWEGRAGIDARPDPIIADLDGAGRAPARWETERAAAHEYCCHFAIRFLRVLADGSVDIVG